MMDHERYKNDTKSFEPIPVPFPSRQIRTAAEQDAGPVVQEINRLDVALANIDQSLRNLERRLSPIVVNHPEKLSGGPNLAPTPRHGSELANRIAGMASAAGALVDQIDSLNSKIEL